ncbi:hypothetical protein HPB50_020266 [Hyalomma asiaticum]|uniref:Uncharacterized protein n=1 Tax=Hyalomma asiaticum TaxID=266040 RepID=A0ACB7RPU9_HYAAI|nr:hypothetical protein HPB50_020266 [Hyalomma asiaticum]
MPSSSSSSSLSSDSQSYSSTSSSDSAWPGHVAVVPDNDLFDLLSNDSGDGSDSEGEPGNFRVGHAEWCSCSHCGPMDTEHESVCCREVQRADMLIDDDSQCITSHPAFRHICLNVHVVAVAYYELAENHPSLVDAPEIHSPGTKKKNAAPLLQYSLHNVQKAER